MDFIMNGVGHGNIASLLLKNDLDPGALRPYEEVDGNTYCTINVNGEDQVVRNYTTPALLTKDEWIEMDEAVIEEAEPVLQAVGDLRSRGLVYRLRDAMGVTVMQQQTMTGITDAKIGMDPAGMSDRDRPKFDITNIPVPVIWKNFSFTMRDLAVSRRGRQRLDTTMPRLAAREVAVQAEKLLLGTADTFTYGGGTLYGYLNYPQANTRTLTNPEAPGWTPNTLLSEAIAMRKDLRDDRQMGPYVMYVTPAWDSVLDEDFSDAKGDNTLRERLLRISGISEIKTLDYLDLTNSAYKIVMTQMKQDTARMVIGMDIQTIQYTIGMETHWIVMAIMLPQLRSTATGQCGINVGAAPAL